MENSEVLRKVITILDRKTTKVENNVRFGNYPFITYHDGHMRIFNFEHESATVSLTGWLMPVGIPFMVKNKDNEDYDGEIKDRTIIVGYYLGNALYIHKDIFDNFVNSYEEKVFYTPAIDDFVYMTPSGWSIEEQKSFSKYLWQMATKTMGGDFREVVNIDFEASMCINSDILVKDGWVCNRIAGKNIFFGIVECPVEQYDMEIDTEGLYLWYNKYLTILDVTGGNGIQTFGMLEYSGTYHPHVSKGGGLCRGNAAQMIQNKLNAGLITEFFILMKDFLSHYSNENPFVSMPVDKEKEGKEIQGSKYLKDKIYIKNLE